MITRYLPVFALFISGLSFGADTVKTVPAQRTLATENGRFVFGQISDARRDQYMLDTRTGQLWQIVALEEKQADGVSRTRQVLQVVSYLERSGAESPRPVVLEDDFGTWLKTQPQKK